MFVRFTIEPGLYENLPLLPTNPDRLWPAGLNLSQSLLMEYHNILKTVINDFRCIIKEKEIKALDNLRNLFL